MKNIKHDASLDSSMEIDTSGYIILDNVNTFLKVRQDSDKTVVYKLPNFNGKTKIQGEIVNPQTLHIEFRMPNLRYSLVHDTPSSGVSGRKQFEIDVRSLIESLSVFS